MINRKYIIKCLVIGLLFSFYTIISLYANTTPAPEKPTSKLQIWTNWPRMGFTSVMPL
jgi:hypothetical protein